MAGIRRDSQAYQVDSTGGHIYKGSAKSVRAMTGPTAFHALIIVLSGGYRADWQEAGETRRVEARAGDVVLREGERAWMESSEPGTQLVTMSLYFRWAHPRLRRQMPLKVSDRGGLIRALGYAVLSNQDSENVHRQSVENGYMGGIVAEFLRLGEEQGLELKGRVTEFVYMNLRSVIGLEMLAKHVGMSPRQLQREYKRTTGMTPMEQVRRVRVECAVRWLMAGGKRRLKDAAQRMGFCNEQALCARIKKHTGMTVRELRGGV